MVKPDKDLRTPPPNADEIRFVLTEVIVEGATVYANDDLLALFRSMLGQETSLTQIYDLARRLTAKYRTDGYILSQVVVPAQRIQGGIVTLRAIEGFVKQVVIEGEGRNQHQFIQQFAEKIAADQPLHSSVLERYILLINDLPGVTARAILKPSATPQAADLIIQVETEAFDGFVGFDNRGTRYLGPFQASAGVNANSLLGRGARTSLQGVMVTQTKELKYVQAAHDHPVGDDGTRLRTGLAVSSAEPGYTLRENAIDSESSSASMEIFHPFIRSRAENLSGTFRIAGRHVTTNQNGGADRLSKDIIRLARLRSDYDFVNTTWGTSVNQMSVEVSQGLDILGARESGSSDLSRTNGRSDFTKANVTVQRLQILADGFSLLVAANSQYALSTLLSSEEFSFGGSQFGRGYDPAEITGEHGVAAKIELRYGQDLAAEWLKSYQFYGFYDAGMVWNRDSDTDTPSRQSGISAGFGGRFNVTDSFSANLEIGVPLTRPADALGDNGNEPRGFFSLIKRF